MGSAESAWTVIARWAWRQANGLTLGRRWFLPNNAKVRIVQR